MCYLWRIYTNKYGHRPHTTTLSAATGFWVRHLWFTETDCEPQQDYKNKWKWAASTRSYFSRVTASYSTTCDQRTCAQDWTASYWSSKTWVSNYQVQAFSWHIQELSNQTDNIQRHYYSLSSVTNEAHQLLHSLHVTDHYFCICRKLLLCERKTSV
jgi:hypothetical protein